MRQHYHHLLFPFQYPVVPSPTGQGGKRDKHYDRLPAAPLEKRLAVAMRNIGGEITLDR
jgi:hypothetical protein